MRTLTFAWSDVVQVELVALLGALQGALGGKEVAGRVEGLVVVAAYLWAKHRAPSSFPQPDLGSPSLPFQTWRQGNPNSENSQGLTHTVD